MVNLGRDVEIIILKYIYLKIACDCCNKKSLVKAKLGKYCQIYRWKCKGCNNWRQLEKYDFMWYFSA